MEDIQQIFIVIMALSMVAIIFFHLESGKGEKEEDLYQVVKARSVIRKLMIIMIVSYAIGTGDFTSTIILTAFYIGYVVIDEKDMKRVEEEIEGDEEG